MTPCDLETLLKCYYLPNYKPTSPATQSAIYKLKGEGLVFLYDDAYTTTDRGGWHVTQLCNLPYPSKKSFWVDGNGRILENEE